MKFIIVVFSLLISAITIASECNNCTVKSLGFGPHYDNLCGRECVFIMVNGNIAGKPACSTDDWHFVLDTSTESGKQTLSALLMAYAANKEVNFAGNNSCTLYGTAEGFLYGYFSL